MASLSGKSNRPPYKRSRNGCMGCKSAKVKCDEQRPKCGRCLRLFLDCRLPQPVHPLRQRRRGNGPLKSRDSWQPPPILPSLEASALSDWSTCPALSDFLDTQAHFGEKLNLSQNENSASDLGVGYYTPSYVCTQPMRGSTSYASTSSPCDGDISLERFGSADVCGSDVNGFAFSIDRNHLDPLCYSADLPLDTSLLRDTTLLGPETDDSYPIYQPTDVVRHCSTTPTVEDLLPFPSCSSNTMALSIYEHLAFSYYQTTYTLSRTTRPFLWSYYHLFLLIASEQPMVKHLILAGSLRQLALDTNVDQQPYILSKQHYEKGLYMLKQSLEERLKPDYLTTTISFWLLYQFILDEGATLDTQNRLYLISGLRDYVLRHRLDGICINALSSQTSRDDDSSDEAAQKEFSLIAKVLLWLFYLDIQFGFTNTGAGLADVLMTREERPNRLFDISQLALEVNWGSKYPRIELINSVENLSLDQLNHEMHILHHKLNRAFWLGVGNVDSISRSLDALEIKHNSIFRLAGNSISHQTRLFQRINIKACEFYALRIYCYRSSCLEVRGPTPPIILTAVTRFLAIIRQIWESDHRPCYFDRELFLVGIETDNQVHRDWILDRIGNGGLKSTLARVWQEQDMRQRRLSSRELKRTLNVDEIGGVLPV